LRCRGFALGCAGRRLCPGLDGIILPKVESATGLATADWLLAQIEREHGLVSRAIELIPIIETARGLNQIDAILASGTRVKRVAFGAGDFTLDVNMAWSRNEAELTYARAKIVTASRAAGIEAPLDTVWVAERARASPAAPGKPRGGGDLSQVVDEPGPAPAATPERLAAIPSEENN
jgi:citrate lyase subunit beta / citryl-CoA lyase